MPESSWKLFLNFHPSPWRWHHGHYNFPSITWRAQVFLETKLRRGSQATAQFTQQVDGRGRREEGAPSTGGLRADLCACDTLPKEAGSRGGRTKRGKEAREGFTKSHEILGEWPVFLAHTAAYKGPNLAPRAKSPAPNTCKANCHHSCWVACSRPGPNYRVTRRLYLSGPCRWLDGRPGPIGHTSCHSQAFGKSTASVLLLLTK